MSSTGKPNRRTWPTASKKKASPAANASTKKRMRSIERLLRRDSLPSDVRQAKLAELASLQQQGQQQRRKERERHFSKKYHKVKFFERRKVERQIVALRRQLEAVPPGSQSAQEELLQRAEEDLLYVKHFPRHKKYLSLFPSGGEEEPPFVAKRRQRIRAGILRRAQAGTLLDPGDAGGEDDEGVEAAAALEDDFFEADAGDDAGDDYLVETV